MAKFTTAQRRKAAKAAWAARRLRAADTPQPAVGLYSMSAVGYDTLAQELLAAFHQSSEGKGKQRHATTGRPFTRQPIMEIGRMVGPGYPAGQAQKKAQEALGMFRRGENDKAIAELHGAIVYLAATAALIREG